MTFLTEVERTGRKVFAYGLCSSLQPGQIRYIGQTIMPVSERVKNHVRHARKHTHRHLSCWINSVIKAGGAIGYVVLDAAAVWNDTERRLISEHRAAGADLVNGTDGGDGRIGYKMSDEQRAHLSRLLKGRKKSPEHIEAISRASKGKVPSAEVRAKISAANKGRAPANLEAIQRGNRGLIRSDELKQRIRVALKGRQVTSTEKLLKNLEAAHGMAQ